MENRGNNAGKVNGVRSASNRGNTSVEGLLNQRLQGKISLSFVTSQSLQIFLLRSFVSKPSLLGTGHSAEHAGLGSSSQEMASGAVLHRKKESVREIFLRQVRDASAAENATTTGLESSGSVVVQEPQLQNLVDTTTGSTNISEARSFLPGMSSDAEVPAVLNGTLGKLNPIKPESRRDTLLDQLAKCTYECMVCCGKIYHRQSIWNCSSCHNAFHLHCIKKWCASSAIREFICVVCAYLNKTCLFLHFVF